MADHEVKYIIRYVVDESKALRGLDAIDARIQKSIALAEKYKATLKGVGSDTTGLATYAKGLGSLDGSLRGTASAAGSAEKQLRDVGKGNSSLGPYTTRLEKLVARLNEASTAAGTAASSLGGVGQGGPGGGGGGGKSGGGTRTAGRIAASVSLITQAVNAARKPIADSMGGRREYLTEAADRTSSYRAGLQELAVLQGKSSADDAMLREQLAFTRASNMTPEAAAEHRLEYGGAIGTVDPANLGPGVKQGLELESARFGARYSLDPQTSGRLAGLIGNFQKIPTVAEGVGTMAEGAEIANVYGVGQVKGIMTAGLQLTGEMLAEEGGRFGSFKGMMARLSATTKDEGGSAPRAATRVRQSNRLLRKLAADTDSEIAKKAGITPEDDYETALSKLAPHITGPGGDMALKASGYKNDTEIKATINEAKSIPLVQRIMADSKMSAARADAGRANAAFGDSLTGRGQLAENQKFESFIETGMIAERMKGMRAAAEGRLGDPRQAGGQRLKAGPLGSAMDTANSLMTTGGAIPGEQLRIDAEAMRGLIEGGRKVGVDVRKIAPGAAYQMDSMQPLDATGVQQEVNKAYDAVVSAGGDPFGGPADKLKRGAELIIEAANGLNRPGGPQRPPMPPPPGDGGAGFNPGRR